MGFSGRKAKTTITPNGRYWNFVSKSLAPNTTPGSSYRCRCIVPCMVGRPQERRCLYWIPWSRDDKKWILEHPRQEPRKQTSNAWWTEKKRRKSDFRNQYKACARRNSFEFGCGISKGRWPFPENCNWHFRAAPSPSNAASAELWARDWPPEIRIDAWQLPGYWFKGHQCTKKKQQDPQYFISQDVNSSVQYSGYCCWLSAGRAIIGLRGYKKRIVEIGQHC